MERQDRKEKRPAERASGAFSWPMGLTLGLGLALIVVAPPSLEALRGPLLLILALAAIAEAAPVEVGHRGLRISFMLPFVAALAALYGPAVAWIADVAVTLLVGAGLTYRRFRRFPGPWLWVNAAIAGISACFGTLGLALAHAIWPEGPQPLAALGFLTGYAFANFLLVTLLDPDSAAQRGIVERLRASGGLAGRAFLAYALLAVAVTTLAIGPSWPWLPLTMLPVLALRSALTHRARMEGNYYETITALTLMLQRAHPYTHGHLERVAQIAEEVALDLGLPRRRARLVREAAVLHDIGKIAVDERVLDKPARLTAPEMEHVRGHAAWGAQILSPVAPFRELVPWIRHHHERPDGMGYPDGLSGNAIPLESRIIAVVDAFDAMVGGDLPGQKRSYQPSRSVPEALTELERCSGTQFDHAVVASFRKILERGRT